VTFGVHWLIRHFGSVQTVFRFLEYVNLKMAVKIDVCMCVLTEKQ